MVKRFRYSSRCISSCLSPSTFTVRLSTGGKAPGRAL